MFFNGFVERTEAYSLEGDITTQENAIELSQKKLTTLQKDERDLVEKIKKYQDDLSLNRDNQKDQQMDTEKQAILLENLKLKRKQ